MTIHVFVGAGPANLHRALKIKKMDPQARIVITDKRLQPGEIELLDRVHARANIFRFENSVVSERLLKDGIDLQEWKKLTYERDFSVAQGFQHGDDKVFSKNRFTQIQIRDLQLLFLNTLKALGELLYGTPTVLIQQDLNIESPETLRIDVANLLYRNRREIGISSQENLDIQIHTATGALQDDVNKNSVIYPEKAKHHMKEATPDVAAMTATPVHGTVTFFIKDQDGKDLLTCEQLERAQRSLDLTAWNRFLPKFGWDLIRPPRIRVFYANDVLYIGAEIPATMMTMKDKASYENEVTDYIRTIGALVFPSLNIRDLPVNPHLRSRFPTARGESGNVLSVSQMKDIPWGNEGGVRKVNMQVFNHGDSRYLPHYQTGSGFVTAFLQNEVYADVYRHKSVHDLYSWAQKNNHINGREESIRRQYTRQGLVTEADVLQAFQHELYMTLSRDIIDENKEKVGRYFNAIHSQSLDAIETNFKEFLLEFNTHHDTKLHIKHFEQQDKRLVVMEMLQSNNEGFLRAVLPKFLNKDFAEADNEKLLHIRDMQLLDLETNMPKTEKSEASRILIRAKLTCLGMEPENLAKIISQMAREFESNKSLHHRAAVPFFFKGVHSDTINAFVKELRDLNASKPSIKLRETFLDSLQRFHGKLEAGNSVRSMNALNEFMKRLEHNHPIELKLS